MNKKITVTLIVILLIASTIIIRKYFVPLVPIKRYSRSAFSKNNKPIILWDIHDVVTKKNFTQIISTIIFFERKLEMFSKLSFALFRDLSPVIFHALRNGSTGESFLVLAQKHGNDALADLIARVANAQTLIPETVDIIKELHARGYTQHIGSNIGTQTFTRFIKKPDITLLFNETYFDFNDSQIAMYDANNPHATIEKPKEIFFQTYLEKNKLDPTRVILIDDKRENVAAAQRVGMYAVLFTDAAQLRTDLWLLLGLPSTPLRSRSGRTEERSV